MPISVIFLILIWFQYSSLSTLYAIILIAIYIVFTIIEIVRLYLGFLGNLTERVRTYTKSKFDTCTDLMFHSPTMKAQVSFSDHILSGICLFPSISINLFPSRTTRPVQPNFKYHLLCIGLVTSSRWNNSQISQNHIEDILKSFIFYRTSGPISANYS